MADPVTIGLMVASTVMQASSQAQAANAAMSEGMARQQAAQFEAQQMRAKAGQERASAQQRMIRTRKQQRLIESELLAKSAASGGGAGDPSVVTLAGEIAKEGEYRALSDLYVGEERARGLESGADVRTFEGEQAFRSGKARQRAGFMQATGTLLSGGSKASDLYSKYNEPSVGIEPADDAYNTYTNYGYG